MKGATGVAAKRSSWLLAFVAWLALAGSAWAQPVTVAPSTLPDGTIGTSYSETLSASGTTGPYIFTVTAGTLPTGLSLASNGVLSGTPSSDGAFSFTITATDFSLSGSQAYTVYIEPLPELTLQPSSLPGGRVGVAYAEVIVADGGVPAYVYSIVGGSLPPGLALANDGHLAGTPSTPGTYGFTIRAEDDSGVSGNQAYGITIAAPMPVGVAQAVSTLAGVAVRIHAAAGATGAPITAVTVVDAPPAGTLVVDGTDLVYTPPNDAAGMVAIGYTISNAQGASPLIRSTVSVDPLPQAASLQATTPMGIAVDLDVSQGATGGPFTAANVVSVAPQSAGNASIAATSGGHYRLTFTPASGFIGAASVVFTLANAHATSAPATAQITVTARQDPTVDREVGGLVAAQVAIVRDFATAQLVNVQDRLETLHEPGSRPWGFWIGGSVRHGDRDATATTQGLDFETSGMSGGADYRFSDRFAIGGGLGYGRDRTRVGDNGSRSDARAASGVGYASFRPSLPWFIDVIGGHQRITFQLRRFVAATGSTVDTPRDGIQDFSSWSGGYQRKGKDGAWGFESYARVDVSKATLDAYDEAGAPLQALSFDEQDIETRTSTVGLRARFKRAFAWGTLEPRLKLELQRDFHDQSGAAIGYSDTPSGPAFVMPDQALDRSRIVFELGTVFKTRRGYLVRVDYRGVQGGLNDHDNSLVFSFQDKH